jgi:hypothetical protein
MLWELEVVSTGSGSCSVKGFGINDVESADSATGELGGFLIC